MIENSSTPEHVPSTSLWSFATLLLWLAICYGAAAVGGYFTSLGLKGYYEYLRKPEWTPPGATIGFIWNILFAMMSVAAWLVWRKAGWFHGAIVVFLVHLLLNVGWSYCFFTMQCPEIAFWELCVLWLSILATALLFWPVSKLAAVLLLPYLGWVLFAGYLNYTIWQMN